jgi:hypothetical protein
MMIGVKNQQNNYLNKYGYGDAVAFSRTLSDEWLRQESSLGKERRDCAERLREIGQGT